MTKMSCGDITHRYVYVGKYTEMSENEALVGQCSIDGT